MLNKYVGTLSICCMFFLVASDSCNEKRVEKPESELPQNQAGFMEKYGFDTVINGVYVKYPKKTQKAEPKIGFDTFDEEMRKRKSLPEEWIAQGIEGGIVRVTILIDKTGEISFGQIWDFGFGSDSMAIDLIQSLGPWNPSILLETGEPVDYEIIVPVYFH